jgi:translation initiation factor IF-2
MSKVRINDLARELEVKSKSILDALTAVGVTEAKTHSSSIEADEAEKVRNYLSGKRSSSSAATKPQVEAKPAFNLAHISKPGDAVKAILARKQAEEEARHAPRRPAATPAPPAVASAPKAASKPVLKASAPEAAAPAAPAPRRVVPQPRQHTQIVTPAAPPPAIASKPPVGPVIARPPVVVAPPPGTHAIAAQPAAAHGAADRSPAAATSAEVAAAPAAVKRVKPAAAPVAVAPAATLAGAAPSVASGAETSEVLSETLAMVAAEHTADGVDQETVEAAVETGAAEAVSEPPVRRVVMPQTGPRPIYQAPAGAAHGIQRGRPIFERPRPQAPGATGPRPASTTAPGARRPMHPTRTFPTGTGEPARPGFAPGSARPGYGARTGGPGLPGAMPGPGETPNGMRPAARPGQRRGGQRYEKTKEGPMKGFQPPPRYAGSQISQEPLPITKTITVTEGISVKDLAEKLDVRGKDLIATLLMKGVFVTVNQSLDGELVKDVARQFGADATVISVEEQLENEAIEGFLEDTTGMVEITRSPVVTVMGHVDHGKTSLLDAIRSTDVAAGEAGGITQHIGAYKVKIAKPDSPAFGREIVFLDTPGHEAFTRMRARGAKITDIVVVVVAADDGVMPQTIEAIAHARAANVPIIVAVNKIDKPEANPDRVKQQLADRGLQPEAWGGSTVFVDVSAKKRTNLDLLLEMVCLVADLANLKATPDRPAVGTVIEAKLDRGRGAVASVLVQNGTLRTGDSYIVGNTFGKIRAMFNDRGQPIVEAGPATPVEILGLEGMPDAGDTFLVMADRDKAKGIAQYRKMKEREAQLAKSSRISLEGLAEQIKQAGMKDLNLILKGDVQGSVEVLADSMQRMSTEKVRVRVLHSGVGAITESDVLLASASNAVIIGFNVRPDRKSTEVAERENVEIRLHSIIYELQDEITKAMYGLLEPVFKENYAGKAEVTNVFKITKVGQIAGCRVTDGVIARTAQVRVLREGEEVWRGKIGSLKRFKDDVSEVRQGVECGIDLAGFKDIRVGDVIESFTTEKLADELGQNSIQARKAEKAAKEAAAEAAAAAEAEAASQANV